MCVCVCLCYEYAQVGVCEGDGECVRESKGGEGRSVRERTVNGGSVNGLKKCYLREGENNVRLSLITEVM